MFKKNQKIYLSLNKTELRLLRDCMLKFRNRVIAQGGPTEDIDAILLKILK